MEIVERVIELMKKIYQLDSKKFDKVRRGILENTVHHFGPTTKGIEREQVYIEPIIKEENKVIGDSDNKCDFIFCEDDSYPVEFIECKANIANMIPHTLPFEEVKKSHKNKIRYLDTIYQYLTKSYKEPKIYFACYNLDYSRELENLQKNWDYHYMGFVNAEEIINGKN